MKLRRLNITGLEKMEGFLCSLATDLPSNYPSSILSDQQTSEGLPVDIDVDPQRQFARRFDVAAYLYDRLALLRTTALRDLERDCGMWSWLSLLWFEQLCPPEPSGGRQTGGLVRWIPVVSGPRRFHRHLLLSAYSVYALHANDPQRAMALLCGPPTESMGRVAERLTEGRLVTSAAVVGLATRLYYDQSTGKLRRGAGGGPGSIRRLADLLYQFDLTYDLESLNVEQLLALLPREFDKFRTRSKAA